MSHHTFAIQLSNQFTSQMDACMERKIAHYIQSLDAIEQAADAFRILREDIDTYVFTLDFYHTNFNGIPFSTRHPVRTAFLRGIFVRYMSVDPASKAERTIRVVGIPHTDNQRAAAIHQFTFPFYVDVVEHNRFYKHASHAQRKSFVHAFVERLSVYQQMQESVFEASSAMAAVHRIAAMQFSDTESIYQLNSAHDFNAVVDYGLDPYALRMLRFFHAVVFGEFFARYESCANFHLQLYLTKAQYESLQDIRDTLYDIGLRLVERSVDKKEDYNADGLLDVEGGKEIRRQKRARYAANKKK